MASHQPGPGAPRRQPGEQRISHEMCWVALVKLTYLAQLQGSFYKCVLPTVFISAPNEALYPFFSALRKPARTAYQGQIRRKGLHRELHPAIAFAAFAVFTETPTTSRLLRRPFLHRSRRFESQK